MMIDDEMGNCLKRVLENWEFEIDLSLVRVCFEEERKILQLIVIEFEFEFEFEIDEIEA